MKKSRILLVDESISLSSDLTRALSTYGAVITAESFKAAYRPLERHGCDVAFIKLRNEENHAAALNLIEECRKHSTAAILVSQQGHSSLVREAYLKGCHSFFQSSKFQINMLEHLEEIMASLQKGWLGQLAKTFTTHDPALLEQIKNATVWKQQNVIITGPTGVGKSKIAKVIHELGEKKKPFVHLNLAELPESLVESTLFGHKKGAFTGAIGDHCGLLEKAHGGTLFLDEVGAISLSLQKKLLRVLDDKSFSPLGSNSIKHSAFRLITSTCNDLETMVTMGKFRLDFYFRIKGTRICILPLKKRREEIIPLIDHFIARSARKIAFSEEATDVLLKYPWPGNVRELENLIRELVNGPRGYITKDNLPSYVLREDDPFGKMQRTAQSAREKAPFDEAVAPTYT